MYFMKYSLLLAIGISTIASAQISTPPIYVSTEVDTDQHRNCQVSNASAVAAVEAGLRHSNIRIASRDELTQGRAIRAYVNINIMRGQFVSGRLASDCFANVSLTLETIGIFVDPVTGLQHIGSMQFCERSSLLTYEVNNIAYRINMRLGDFMNQCLSEYPRTILQSGR